MAVFRDSVPRTIPAKLLEINWSLVLLLGLLGMAGAGMLYSLAGGSWSPWANDHALRFGVAFVAMLVIAMFPPRFWMGVAYPAYMGALVLLALVPVIGVEVNFSQRWLDIGPLRLQPSEPMKIAVALALARYYHDLPLDKVSNLGGMIVPAALIGMPAALIAYQPDLGTTILLVATGGAIIFLAGLSWKIIIGAAVPAISGAIAFVAYGLQDYQRERVFCFLDPWQDPTGCGYQSIQATIALGSGGLTGKGFMEGTQSQLDFLPEKQTDFIFTILGEEFGFVGSIAILAVYALIIAQSIGIATSCKSVFLRLVSMGVATTFALYVMINVAMVSGMLPVVGVPLTMATLIIT